MNERLVEFLRTPSGWFVFLLAEAAVAILVAIGLAQVFPISREVALLVLVAAVLVTNYLLRRRLSL